MRARKRFGQNFLTDQNLIQKIVRSVNPKPDDHVIEIGPGHGALTELILKTGCHLDVIEIDRDLIAELGNKHPQLNIFDSDVLKFDFSKIERKGPLRIVGNLPYNISTPLLFKLFKEVSDVKDMHFMLQLEVVNRMTAEHSSKDYGRLSIMSQYYCNNRKLFHVPPEAFIPRPKVTSAIVRLMPKGDEKIHTDITILEAIVLQAFSQRRKTIRNALGAFLDETDLSNLELDPKLRPENLSLDVFAGIASYLSKKRK